MSADSLLKYRNLLGRPSLISLRRSATLSVVFVGLIEKIPCYPKSLSGNVSMRISDAEIIVYKNENLAYLNLALTKVTK